MRAAPIQERILSHWLWAAALILVAAALAIPQLDDLAIGLDGINSYVIASGLSVEPWTAEHVINHLYQTSPDQAPFYFVLLHYWGKLAGHSLAAARLIALYAGLLSLAMVYRLARDFISPPAGFFAGFVLLSNSFYAHYFAHIRYYTLVTFLSALIIWLYLRLVRRPRPPAFRELAALALACYALASVHAFGLLLYVVLSIYHLLSAQKGRGWWQIASAALVGLALAAPQFSTMLTAGLSYASAHHGPRSAEPVELYAAWLNVIGNGAPVLLVISGLGVFIGWRRGHLRGNPLLPLFPLLVFAVGLSSAVSGIVSAGQMRYFLAGMPIVVCFIAAGLCALHRQRRWLGLLAAFLWLMQGAIFMQTADWEGLIQGRTWSYTHPPWHLVSRWARQSGESMPMATFGVSRLVLQKRATVPKDLESYWFGDHGIVSQRRTPDDLLRLDARFASQRPAYLALRQSLDDETYTVADIDLAMRQLGYSHCENQRFPNQTAVAVYRWISLACGTRQTATFETAIGSLLFHGAHEDAGRLFVSGYWQAGRADSLAEHNLSFQLLDSDWKSHAQLDLSLLHMGELRQHIINVAHVAPGEYRLVAIVYHAESGERQAWQDNAGWIPELQPLADIVIAGDAP